MPRIKTLFVLKVPQTGLGTLFHSFPDARLSPVQIPLLLIPTPILPTTQTVAGRNSTGAASPAPVPGGRQGWPRSPRRRTAPASHNSAPKREPLLSGASLLSPYLAAALRGRRPPEGPRARAEVPRRASCLPACLPAANCCLARLRRCHSEQQQQRPRLSPLLPPAGLPVIQRQRLSPAGYERRPRRSGRLRLAGRAPGRRRGSGRL